MFVRSFICIMFTTDIQKRVCIHTDRYSRCSSIVAFIFENTVKVAQTYTSSSMGLRCSDYIQEQRKCLCNCTSRSTFGIQHVNKKNVLIILSPTTSSKIQVPFCIGGKPNNGITKHILCKNYMFHFILSNFRVIKKFQFTL